MDDFSSLERWLFILAFTTVFTWMTWRGLDVSGNATFLLTLMVLAPFAVMSLCLAGRVRVNNWFRGPASGSVDWRGLLHILFWNLNYYDSASAFAGDCANPARVFPRAMKFTLVCVSLSYLLPLAATTGADPDADYCDGCFADIARDNVGKWLAGWIAGAAFLSCVGLFVAEMASDSFQIMGMADRGQLPSCVARRSRYGTPTYGVALSAVGVVCLSQLDFEAIVELVNVLYAVAELVEIVAFMKLRHSHAHVPRPYRIPVDSDLGMVLFFMPASLFLVILIGMSSVLSWILAGTSIVLTTTVYFLCCLARDKKWTHFHPVDHDWCPSRDPPFVTRALTWLGVPPHSPRYHEPASLDNGERASTELPTLDSQRRRRSSVCC